MPTAKFTQLASPEKPTDSTCIKQGDAIMMVRQQVLPSVQSPKPLMLNGNPAHGSVRRPERAALTPGFELGSGAMAVFWPAWGKG